jgi:DNA repair protein RadA/Sms
VAGAVRGVALGGDAKAPLACFGEVGLTGELRSVAHADRRLAEARKFGLSGVVHPESAPTLRAALRVALGEGAGRAAA